MGKSKIKNEMIFEYVNLSRMEKILLNLKIEKYKNDIVLCQKLKGQYEQIMFRMKMMNLSFAILQKEIKMVENITISKANPTNLILENIQKTLLLYSQKITDKMKKLSLNEFEINYILSFVEKI